MNFIFLLFFAGALSLFVPKNRLSFLWPFVSLSVVVYALYSLYVQQNQADFLINWNALPNLPVTIGINPLHWKSGALGVLLLSALVLYYSSLDSREPKKQLLGGLVLLNSVLMLIAFSSANYIQLLAAVGISDVLVYMAINNFEAKRQYIYGNFLADFMLLNIMAVILGQQGGIDISKVEEYSRHWHHRDFISILLLICIFIKSGLVFFHTAYQKMSTISFNRLNFILFATTPLMGMIVLHLLQDVLLISKYSYPLLKIFSVATVLWGTVGAMIIDNLKRRSIYMSMLFWGLSFAAFSWLPEFSGRTFFIFLISAFLFGNVLMLAEKAASDEILVSHMGGFSSALKITLIASIISALLYIGAWWCFANQVKWLALGGVVFLTFVTAHLLSEIYSAPIRANEWVMARLKNPSFLFFIPIVGGAVVLFFKYLTFWPYVMGFAMLWMAIFMAHPFSRLAVLYDSERIQKNDLITVMYSVLIFAPLQILGRILRLTIDFVFIERTVIASVKNIVHLMIFVFQRLHKNYIGYIFFVFLGVVIVFCAYFNGVKQ